ncbi:ROK family transcriptional regulator [Streptomyces sp. NPDC048172]|uniref:ROK family transcriptional regulator n=1 Tax=Streptomyces sp. NPDC048172 TaxID=3365505 RepID=UPI003713F279
MGKTKAAASMGEAGWSHARILQALYDLGPLSRADLARVTGASRSTLTALVQQLMDQGLLAEQESRPSSPSGGKPSRPLWISPQAPPVAVAHLLPGRLECALVSAGGQLLARVQREFTPGSGDGEAATAALLDGLRDILARTATPPLGIGVAVGGMVDTDTGTVISVALAPELDGLPLAAILRAELGAGLGTGLGTELVCVDMHPRAQALGDRWFGQGRGRSRFASLYTGEALGVGLVLNGEVHRGPAGTGGEIGHSIVQLDGRACHCGQRGCWETVAGHDWLRAEATRLRLPGAATLTAGPLTRLAAAEVPHAAELVERWAANLSAGLVNLHQIFAPGLFILHGDVAAGGEQLRGRIEHHLHARIPSHPAGPPQVALTALDDDATLLGAAGLVLSEQLRAMKGTAR